MKWQKIDLNWLEMAKMCQKWPKIAYSGLELAKNGLKDVRIGQKWATNGKKLFR